VGRPRTFDIDHAINVAADMFWRRGYEGTSIGDLTKALGISAPSFYFAFGSKDGVFRRIIDLYLERQSEIVERAFGKADSRSVVASLLSGFGELHTSPDHAPGCLILNNSLPICDDHPFRAEWALGRAALRARLNERFSADQQSEVGFPQNWKADDTARLVVSLIWGIAVETHSGASAREIQDTIDQFMATWPVASDANS
jgi:AcrR family transcriptional regulator